MCVGCTQHAKERMCVSVHEHSRTARKPTFSRGAVVCILAVTSVMSKYSKGKQTDTSFMTLNFRGHTTSARDAERKQKQYLDVMLSS